MKVLVVDIGGTNFKMPATGQKERRRFESGPNTTPQPAVAGVKQPAADWKHDVIAMGYSGRALRNWSVAEPHNLAKGGVRFNFAAAFKRPVPRNPRGEYRQRCHTRRTMPRPAMPDSAKSEQVRKTKVTL